MIYSFYGRLSVASMDEEALRAGDLPPTFYCYGTEDPFYRQFEAQYDLMQRVGVSTRRIVLEDWPYGFGGDGDRQATHLSAKEENRALHRIGQRCLCDYPNHCQGQHGGMLP